MSSQTSTIAIKFKSQQEIDALVDSVQNQLQAQDYNSLHVASDCLQLEHSSDETALHNLIHKAKCLVDASEALYFTQRELEITKSFLLDQLYVMHHTEASFKTVVEVYNKLEKASINV